MNKGLTSKELKTFKELLIKANDDQVFLLLSRVNKEFNNRLEQTLKDIKVY